MRLKATREKSGKTQAEVAKLAGVPEQAYQRYEYGQHEPGVTTAIRIADALGVGDIRELFAAVPGNTLPPMSSIPQQQANKQPNGGEPHDHA